MGYRILNLICSVQILSFVQWSMFWAGEDIISEHSSIHLKWQGWTHISWHFYTHNMVWCCLHSLDCSCLGSDTKTEAFIILQFGFLYSKLHSLTELLLWLHCASFHLHSCDTFKVIAKSRLVKKLIKTSIRRLTFIFCSSSSSEMQTTLADRKQRQMNVFEHYSDQSLVWAEAIKAPRTSRQQEHSENHFQEELSNILENLGSINAALLTKNSF